MTIESVKNHIESLDYNIEFVELGESSATVELAAEALGVKAENIAKSLGIRLKERDILVLVSGTKRLDNKKFRKVFKEKPRFIKGEDLLEATGHPVGGLTPFGLNKNLEVYIDSSVGDLDLVYPAGGSSDTCLKIKTKDLLEIFDNGLIDVTI